MITPAQLKQRHLVGEVMDQPDLDVDRHTHALRGLSRINWISNASSAMVPPILQLAKESDRPLRILDLATGGGDLPVALSLLAKRRGLRIELEGCDKSLTAIQHATENALRKKASVRFFVLDLIDDEIPPDFDVVLCSLFLHHLDTAAVTDLLQRIRQRTRKMLIVADLRRSYAGYVLAWAGTRVLSRSSVVHTDGPLSVRAAFTIAEMIEIARLAGLDGASITRSWPFRFLLTWKRT